MIEIIEKPTHKCSVCGCVFSFDKEDLVKDPFGLRVVKKVHNLFLQCPVCGTYSIAFENNTIKL